MKKVIIYGLGLRYRQEKEYINREFNVVGLSDKDKKFKELEKYIPPEKINMIDFDLIYVTSKSNFESIKNELSCRYGIENEKIICRDNVWWGGFDRSIRDNWVINQLREIEPQKIILDAGAGNQIYKKYCEHLNYISQDFGELDETKIDYKISIPVGDSNWKSNECNIISDIISIPLPDESVDVVLCTEVFEHIIDPIRAIDEFYRLLKRKGKVVITAPYSCLTHMAPFFYYSGFSKYWYKKVFEDRGFIIEELTPIGNWFTYLKNELIRSKYMIEEYGEGIITDEEYSSIIECTRILAKEAELDKGSNEIMCQGYMLKARKDG